MISDLNLLEGYDLLFSVQTRGKWQLNWPKSDHRTEFCALKPISRPFDFRMRTHPVRSTVVWSEVKSGDLELGNKNTF